MGNKKMIKKLANCRIIDDLGIVKECDVYISKGKISSVKAPSDSRNIPEKEQYDLKGKIVIPGLIDCHCHLFSLAESFIDVNLEGSDSIRDMQNRIRQYLEDHPSIEKLDWVFGRGWDQEKFIEKRFPSRRDLDSVLPKNKAIMSRICAHIAVMNTMALEYMEKKGCLDNSTSTLVPREPEGMPNGIIKETALTKAWSLLPKESIQDFQLLFLRSQKEALRFGLIGVHCILDNVDQLTAIKRLDHLGKIQLKLSLFISLDLLTRVESMTIKERESFLFGKKFHILGFKLFADGSLGARTAALVKPYSDDLQNKGILNYSDDQIRDYARRVKQLGLVLATHAIGDRAVEQTLRAYEAAGIVKADGFRIEHCSVVRRDLLRRLSKVILVVQPSFASSDFWLHERIGKTKSKRFAYAFKTLGDITSVAGSSDSPVESIDPLAGISAAISNRADPGESLSMIEAIRLYSKNAAPLSPLTLNSGSVEKGKDCDMVILDVSDPNGIPHAKVLAVFIDGLKITG